MKSLAPEERTRIIRELDIEAYLESIKNQCDNVTLPTEEEALIVLHKSRFFIARAGYIDRRFMLDSRRWLLARNLKLPD